MYYQNNQGYNDPYAQTNQYNTAQVPYYQPMDQGYDKQAYGNNPQYDFDLGEFSDAFIRKGFIRKVYGLLAFELFFTIGMIALALYTGMGDWLIRFYYVEYSANVYVNGRYYATGCLYGGSYLYGGECSKIVIQWRALFWVSMFMSMILHCVLMCGQGVARRSPINLLVTLVYLIFFGFFISGICLLMAIYIGTIFVWEAWGITFSIVFFLTLLVCVTDKDLTMAIAAPFIILPTILTLTIFAIFFPSAWIWIMICSLFVIIYGFFLIFETSMILGKGRIRFGIDDYLIASLLLFGTIIQMFIRIMEIIAIARGGR